MKKFSKILSVALLVALVLSLGVANAFAEGETHKITITRDDSWGVAEDGAEIVSKETTYTYYKIFDADITQLAAEGVEGNVVYTVSTEAEANAIVGTGLFNADLASDGLYYVTLVDSSTGAEAIVAALKTMVEGNPTVFSGTELTTDATPVVIDGLTDGYYLILASNGKNAAVQTIGDVTIKEKNDYPTIDKKEKKENGDWVDTSLPVELNTYIDYQVTVSIPAEANQPIYVVDKMSSGLDYDETTGLKLSPEVSYEAIPTDADEYDAEATWQIMFPTSVVTANAGSDIVITYRALVTEAALVDTGRDNEVTLKYDDNNYVVKDKVDYTTYFAGIYKVDPNDADADMAGVKFKLTLNDADPTATPAKEATAVNVKWVEEGGYYVVDPSSNSNEVVTRADGTNYTIKIRGLDDDKTYILTETETKTGYNLLNGPVTLTKIEDKGTAFADKAADTYDRVENNKGTQLPSTGGIGTTIFYVVGGVLVLAAIILLVTKKRMSE